MFNEREASSVAGGGGVKTACCLLKGCPRARRAFFKLLPPATRREGRAQRLYAPRGAGRAYKQSGRHSLFQSGRRVDILVSQKN